MSTLHLSCSAEGPYVKHAAAMLHSALTHRGGLSVQVYVLTSPETGRRARRKLARMVEDAGAGIRFFDIEPERLEGIPEVAALTLATWHRAHLPTLLPEVERVLHLDSDVIVMDSLEPLWATELAGKSVAAVTNVFQPDHLERQVTKRLPGPGTYFNTGVLLMDLGRMRRDRSMDRALDLGRERGREFGWGDQDALNIIFEHDRLPLHPRWNCMNSVFRYHEPAVEMFGREAVEEARTNPAVRHFEGPAANKPWHLLCQDELREVYGVHRRQTPWPRWWPDGVTARNVRQRVFSA